MRICVYLTVVSVVVFVLASAGCGGTRGVTEPNPVPTRTLRALSPGLSWTYLVFGKAGSTSSSVTSPIEGTLTEEVTAAPSNGSSVLAMVASGSYTIGDASSGTSYAFDRRLYFSQDAKNNLVELGETESASSQTRTTSGVNIFVPGTFSPSVSYDETVSFTDGSSKRHTFAVKSRERITTAGGTFDTWKCVESTTDGPLSTNETKWYAPDLGAYVYDEVIQTNQSSGTRLSYSPFFTL